MKKIDEKFKRKRNLLLLLTITFWLKILLIFLSANEGTKIFINCSSEISLIIQGNGIQNLLYKKFPPFRSESKWSKKKL